MNGGYSFIWLTLLFILGGIIKKCEIGKNLKKYQIILIIFGLYLITFLYKMHGIEFSIMNLSINKDILISYISPTILIASIMYVILFSKLKFNNTGNKIIKFIAPSVFSIYILNNHNLIWDYIMKDLFIDKANEFPLTILLNIFGFTIIFACISVLLDKLRLLIFKSFKIDKLINKIENLLNKEEQKN